MASDTSFYSGVVLIAVIILIITLIWLGIELSKAKEAKDFPPSFGTCPDYWVQHGNSCQIPLNRHPNNKGIFAVGGSSLLLEQSNTPGIDTTTNTIDMTNPGWKTAGKSEKCNKQGWASNYGVVWDGISNYNKC